jgi:hypothetical protein
MTVITRNTYTGNGSSTDFSIGFAYLDRSHVYVTVNNVAVTSFTFFNSTTVRFNTAPATGAAIVIYRETPDSALLADFTPASALREQDLELDLQQNLNIVQELKTNLGLTTTTGNSALATATAAQIAANTALATANTAQSTANTALLAATTGSGGSTSTTSNYTAASFAAIAANSSTPVGTIVWLKQPIASPPSGYLYCNGVDKQRNQYNALFNEIGTAYGVGDGSTTFGFPLESNLINPFADVNYHPFIKYGSRTSGPGQIFAKVVDTTTMAGWIVDALNVTATLSFTGGTGLIFGFHGNNPGTSGTSFSADGTLLTTGSSNTSGQNVFVWKKSGNSFSLITTSPALVSAVPATATALSPDGNYLAVVSRDLTTSFWIYKANSTRTVYSLLTTKSFATAFNTYGPTHITWSDSGNYLALNNHAGPFAQPPGGSQIRLFARSGDTFTEMTGPTASYANDSINTSAFSPDDSFYAFATSGGYLNIYSRSGSSYSLLTTQSGGGGLTLRWPDNTKILVAQTNGSKLFTFNGAAITAVASNGTFVGVLALSKFTSNQFYHLENGNLYSWDASYNVSLVGSTTGQVVTGYCATAALSS